MVMTAELSTQAVLLLDACACIPAAVGWPAWHGSGGIYSLVGVLLVALLPAFDSDCPEVESALADGATQLASIVSCNSQKLKRCFAGTGLLLHACQHFHKLNVLLAKMCIRVLVKAWWGRCLSFVQNHTALKSVDNSSDRSEGFACILLSMSTCIALDVRAHCD